MKPPLIITPYLGEAQFKRLFYRMVDSREGVDGDKLREIEMAVFRAGVKEEVETYHSYWRGAMDHNSAADLKISKLVKGCIKD